MRGLTGRSRWGSELCHIVTARGVAGGLHFCNGRGALRGGNRACLMGGDWHMVGVQLVIMEDRLQGRGAAGARVVCFLSFLFLFCSFGDEPGDRSGN